ncbi:divergent polysaccharide deacetylase family protein [Jiella sp. MQZ9-1]|uniref:Divergent polysaccharide deacetylase family protein n=1 Tax=Jiella flava TaxID=2816857 RepID=A0A939FXD1_9HYPH|nr:divergent polysaccharide deacetylase family protein [Jiella flava]MBO0663255.1 divergent polysaccharide deacetylase family protein [Jiella flava]MCD2471831.1 divergent polysaccharide deacetylase family protein [Jiella flava]
MSIEGELYRPLGLKHERRPVAWRLPTSSEVLLVVGMLTLAATSVWVVMHGHAPRRMADILAEPAARPAPVVVDKRPKIVARPMAVPQGPTIITPNGISQPATFRVEDPTDYRQPPSMAYMPDPALIEKSPYGPLPIRAADGRRPFDVYRGSWSGKPATRIAIVVGGMGISQTGSMEAVDQLPKGVTFGFSPTGNSLDRWMHAARRGGHELLLQVPLEPFGYPSVNPGRGTFTVAQAAAGKFADLYAALGSMTNYVGVMNYMGGRFVGDKAAMDPFISELGRRGLMYFDDGSQPRSLGKDTALVDGVPAATANILLDDSQDPAAIDKQLDTLENIARAQGSAIGVASAFEQSIETIAAWIPEAEKRGIEIVPVSALAYDPEAN